MLTLFRRSVMIVPMSLILAGCANFASPRVASYVVGDLGTLTYRAVDQIMAADPGIAPDTPLAVTSLSDTQNLEKSSALGNIVADMMRTRLVQDGYVTSEIRLRNAVSLQKNEGEFLLSRNSKQILPSPNVAAILTGTYAASSEKVYISLKLISISDGRIIAGTDYVVPFQSVAELLQPHGG